jgi:hypothetical protein
MDYLIIRKENQDIFVEIYDKVTGEYFKNESLLTDKNIKKMSTKKGR